MRATEEAVSVLKFFKKEMRSNRMLAVEVGCGAVILQTIKLRQENREGVMSISSRKMKKHTPQAKCY